MYSRAIQVVVVAMLVGLIGSVMGASCSGCDTLPTWQTNEKAQYLAAQEALNATIRVLTPLREAGKFTVDESKAITDQIDKAQGLLDQWDASIKAGKSPPAEVQEFWVVLSVLNDYRRRA